MHLLFNRDLNRGCLVCMFSLCFSACKFLVKLRRQFRVRRVFFGYVKFFVYKFLRDLQSFHFMFKILEIQNGAKCSHCNFYFINKIEVKI